MVGSVLGNLSLPWASGARVELQLACVPLLLAVVNGAKAAPTRPTALSMGHHWWPPTTASANIHGKDYIRRVTGFQYRRGSGLVILGCRAWLHNHGALDKLTTVNSNEQGSSRGAN